MIDWLKKTLFAIRPTTYMHTHLLYTIFLFYTMTNKVLTHTPFINKWQRGLPKTFFLSTNPPPPPPTPYWYRALFLSAIILILSRHQSTALPTHRFFSSTFFLTRQLSFNSLHWQITIIVRLIYTNDNSRKNAQYDDLMYMRNLKKKQLISIDISAHTRSKESKTIISNYN